MPLTAVPTQFSVNVPATTASPGVWIHHHVPLVVSWCFIELTSHHSPQTHCDRPPSPVEITVGEHIKQKTGTPHDIWGPTVILSGKLSVDPLSDITLTPATTLHFLHLDIDNHGHKA